MSKLIETLFTCKRCKDRFKLKFLKPSLLKKTKMHADCPQCGTEYALTIGFKKHSGFKDLDVTAEYKTRKPADEVNA